MKQAIVWCLLLIMLITGCQKTPSEEIVSKKNTDRMIEMASASNEQLQIDAAAGIRSCYGIPNRYEKTLKGVSGKLIVQANADIIVPSVAEMPVLSVEATNFSQEMVSNIFSEFCGDADMNLSKNVMTKHEYEARIIETKARLTMETKDTVKEILQSQIAEYALAMQNAPEEAELLPADGTLQVEDITNQNTGEVIGSRTLLRATGTSSEGRRLEFHVSNNVTYSGKSTYVIEHADGTRELMSPSSSSILRFQFNDALLLGPNTGEGDLVMDATEMSLTDEMPKKSILSITPNQARMIAEEFLKAAKITEQSIENVQLYSSWNQSFTDGNESVERQMYVVRCLRNVNGVSVASTGDEMYTDSEFSVQWNYESCLIFIDDTGLVGFQWKSPLKIKKAVVASAKMLPWSDIQNIFESMIVIQASPAAKSRPDGETLTFVLDRVELSLQRIIEQNSYTTGLLVPVWNFYGRYRYDKIDGTSNYTAEIPFWPQLSVNAIDGSVINMLQGY